MSVRRVQGTVIGIDYGDRRIGLAVGHPLTGRARPLKTLSVRGEPWLELERLVHEWAPERLILGLPLDTAGQETDMSRRVRQFARELAERLDGIAVELHDERLTSQAAAAEFAAARRAGLARRKHARELDSRAAALILESWMARHG